VLAVLVAFSRLYLGEHTPLDVLTAVGIALPLLCLCYRPAGAAMQSVRVMAGLLFGMIALGAAFTLYAECCPLPTDAEAEFVRDGVKNAWSLLALPSASRSVCFSIAAICILRSRRSGGRSC
ncbi:MAG: phosphatase PAP2 family protein, partial [Oscillospiraceae bacterium]|nr:phosphatase PAP2 family protein [Oscillospiraceae bacterium]